MPNKIKKFFKAIPLAVRVKRTISSVLNGSFGITRLNLIQTFPLFTPRSSGRYHDRAALTIESINQVFPLFSSFAKVISKSEISIKKIESLSKDPNNLFSSKSLKKILDEYGSDKANRHKYHHVYGAILCDKDNVKNIFEIGLGTNNIDVVSSMGTNGKPGASLRAFRDFCPNANIYGADVDKRILFEEERIKTFFVDQTNPKTFDPILNVLPKNFDLVIDDGLHSPNANLASLEFGLKIVKVGGSVVIEDIGDKAITFWETVAALLPKTYEANIYSSDWSLVFVVKKLS